MKSLGIFCILIQNSFDDDTFLDPVWFFCHTFGNKLYLLLLCLIIYASNIWEDIGNVSETDLKGRWSKILNSSPIEGVPGREFCHIKNV